MDAKDCEQYNTDHPCCICKNRCGYEMQEDNDLLRSMLAVERKQKELMEAMLTEINLIIYYIQAGNREEAEAFKNIHDIVEGTDE